ncbi:hypothetical protein Y032_0242g3411 [Ancylostoma ceylanicum]|uniref:MULE transposase domain-containing protein n=1 Tax=Ancylostoma ceylanicum TaxID=53326 RepID=A0A016SDF9_9BILA|nr:hypothetical protein Y032_0242g3411 [Ancylostoma ceylanicum]
MNYNGYNWPHGNYNGNGQPRQQMQEGRQTNQHQQHGVRGENQLYCYRVEVPDWVNAYLTSPEAPPEPDWVNEYVPPARAPLPEAGQPFGRGMQQWYFMEPDSVNQYLAPAPAVDVQPLRERVEEAQYLMEPDWVKALLLPAQVHLPGSFEANGEGFQEEPYFIAEDHGPDQREQRPQKENRGEVAPSDHDASGTSSAPPARYPGERERSQRGVNKVLVYNVPESIPAYVFCYHKKSAKESVYIYQCTHCKKNKKYTSIMVQGDDFLKDPTMVAHGCIPIERTKDKTNRMSYEEVRKDKQATLQPTISYWLKVIDKIETIDWGDYEKGCECDSTSPNEMDMHKESLLHTPNMDNVPNELRHLPDGRLFLHLQEAEMRIYYSVEVLKVPLLFAITRHKTEDDYMIVFGKLKEVLQSASTEEAGEEPRLRIVVDFEKAATNAARRVFPQCSLERCGWHLSQAWVRKRSALGLLRSLRGEEKEARVVRWWRSITGTPFLPKDKLELVNALRTQPVEEGHPAYEPCTNFLNYFHTYENMWCEYHVYDTEPQTLPRTIMDAPRIEDSPQKGPS